MVLANKLNFHRVLISLVFVFKCRALECHQTHYPLNDQLCCPKCPIGTYVRSDCTERGSTSCRPCVNGTYMDSTTGLKICFPCKNCNAGSGLEIKLECTRNFDAVCKPLDGFYCVDQVADGCIEARKHKNCQPGQYISQKGTPFSDTVCNDCVGETFSNGTITFCHPHRKCDSQRFVRRPGNATTDVECWEKRIHMGLMGSTLFLLIVVIGGGCDIFRRKQTAKEMQPVSAPIQT
ncbi:tumor necrosis factor receptor superfamily member 14-like [Syngnathus scovelli]|uniref:tumor necrosis factor receptor superfamily member 14-like n=1 Tax=Syngnathus scovelli TaxID=161590 RepID=UPI002110C4DA|nr:tumor necrosis factor receptor superfamily member 14-like [Syngnathus scovelli]XP_049608402.1 tumor necrosis factor receptor superfamily member 14-like [Syngnathus scovelli]XP_049608403.1 tumor necrosis factor receptor superfamily member 14-like [Syngnathus scovelli]